jgi:hypothetical protein
MMKKILTYAASALALASCSSDSLVSDSPVNNEAPIAFNVGQKNITRTALEDAKYYDFGVWAYKYKAGDKDPALVMGNYQVGCAGYDGFAKEGVDKGKWFYEGLGSSEKKQVLRYWDLSYDNTKFFAYAPYASDTKVECDQNYKKLTVPASVNSDENNIDIIYAGAVMSNATHADVPLQFKHLRAKVILKFYEDIPGYTVKLIDVKDANSGIQLTPATFDDTKDPKYSPAYYYTAYDAVIDFSNMSNITVDAKDLTAATTEKTQNNLIFKLPTETGYLPDNSNDAFASATTYYAVAQPSSSNTGFTLHVSYELTAADNSEKIIIRDARVYIPARDSKDKNIAVWEANTQYTYTFRITTNTNGSTTENPTITDPSIPDKTGLYPIVFDDVTIVDYDTNDTEY